jgi:hypothetical protein
VLRAALTELKDLQAIGEPSTTPLPAVDPTALFTPARKRVLANERRQTVVLEQSYDVLKQPQKHLFDADIK